MRLSTFIHLTALTCLISMASCTKTATSPNPAPGTILPPPNKSGTGGITGSVTPASVLCQLEAVEVLTGTVKATTTSDSKGNFSFSNLSPAKYNIRATPNPDPNNLGIHTWIGVIVSAGAFATIGPISF